MHPIKQYIAENIEPSHSKRYIITGGPCVGKSTLIDYLQNLSQDVVYEAATMVILDEKNKGVENPKLDPNFGKKIFSLQKSHMEAMANKTHRIIFDRSIFDTMTYDCRAGVVPNSQLIKAGKEAIENKYFSHVVFLLENLGKCEVTEVRDEKFEDILEIEQKMKETYTSLGFKVILIPRYSIDKQESIRIRAHNILAMMEQLENGRPLSETFTKEYSLAN